MIFAATACLAALPVPALAAEPPVQAGLGACHQVGCGGAALTGQSSGFVGSVDLSVDGQLAQAAPIAPCAVGGVGGNRTDPITVGTRTSFGAATTTCTSAPDGTAHVGVSGQRFTTTVLSRFGGPVIRARTFESTCDTTTNGSSGRMGLGGVSGVAVPSTIPANYTVVIPGAAPDTRPMAVVVFNEVTVTQPSDGSLTITAMHLKLFPNGGPARGDIVVGTASCVP
jgi:hypothetical protein